MDEICTNRIRPEEVYQAFVEEGLIPMRRGFFNGGDVRHPVCACAVGALKYHYDHEAVFAMTWGELNYGTVYMTGFYSGFDGESVDEVYRLDQRYKQGYEDGQAAWVKVEPLTKVTS